MRGRMKCASDTHPNGYIFTGEWEIWEWDLAHTFNYAEMALLIAPRLRQAWHRRARGDRVVRRAAHDQWCGYF